MSFYTNVCSCSVWFMQLAIDSTAGERERGSLEPLLLNPVPRGALAAGKWLAASLFGCCAVLFSMLLTINVMRRVPCLVSPALRSRS